MKTALDILDQVRIASPCPVPWEAMTGGDRVRRCGQCDCIVYNLSALTAADAVAFLRQNQGDVCIQLWRRRDGTLITADCSVGARQRLRRAWARVVAVAAS